MKENSFYLMVIIVVILIGGFVVGMYTINKNLQKGKSVKRAIIFPLLFGFILAICMLVLAFSYI